jgi:hypothetical protein
MSQKEKNVTPAECKPISVGGWIGTLLLSAVPGVNLILWIIWSFAAKNPSRRSFATAMLILTLTIAVAALVLICLYGTQMLEWARQINPNLFTDLISAVG